MKIFLRFLLTLILVLSLFIAPKVKAQENGAFGAPVLKYTSLVGQSALLAGGRFGWIINKSFVLGGGIYSVISRVKANSIDPVSGQEFVIALNYGGLEFEYVMLSGLPVHASFDMLFAGGGLAMNVPNKNVPHTSFYGQDLLVWEPGVNMEIKIIDWLHFDAGISYRIISSFNNFNNISKDDLQGLNGVITFKFGNY